MPYRVYCYSEHGRLGLYASVPAADAAVQNHVDTYHCLDVDWIAQQQHWRLLDGNDKVVHLFRTREKARTAKKLFETENEGVRLKLVRHSAK